MIFTLEVGFPSVDDKNGRFLIGFSTNALKIFGEVEKRLRKKS